VVRTEAGVSAMKLNMIAAPRGTTQPLVICMLS
jgi:hypothetical protein